MYISPYNGFHSFLYRLDLSYFGVVFFVFQTAIRQFFVLAFF